MNLQPLLNEPIAIQVHAFLAFSAFLFGGSQLVLTKGTLRHRLVGWIWVLLMLVVAISSFWIHAIRQFGPFSLIHLLSIWTLITVPFALFAARQGRIRAHRIAMMSLFFGALVVAGALTLLPGRVMHDVVFGL